MSSTTEGITEENVAGVINQSTVTGEDINSTSFNSSQTNITTPCASCNKITSKKDRVFECSKCKRLIHHIRDFLDMLSIR